MLCNKLHGRGIKLLPYSQYTVFVSNVREMSQKSEKKIGCVIRISFIYVPFKLNAIACMCNNQTENLYNVCLVPEFCFNIVLVVVLNF